MSTAPDQGPEPKRDRSPNFPNIGLTKAVERLRALFGRARRHEVRLADVASAWRWAPKSSAVLQTVAALLAYGLLEDSGTGDARKVKISDLGWRILEDERPGVREASLAEAALKPKLIAELADHWKDGRVDDTICISELKFERGFNDDSAKRFLAVFDDTIQYAKRKNSDTKPDTEVKQHVETADKGEKKLKASQAVKIGDFVQWTSNGQDQFSIPRRVEWLSEDGSHLRVFGSMTGIPVNEVTIAEPPKVPPLHPKQGASSAYGGKDGELNVLLSGGRLQITADVDLAGLQRLKEILTRYEGILELLNPPAKTFDFSKFESSGGS